MKRATNDSPRTQGGYVSVIAEINAMFAEPCESMLTDAQIRATKMPWKLGDTARANIRQGALGLIKSAQHCANLSKALKSNQALVKRKLSPEHVAALGAGKTRAAAERAALRPPKAPKQKRVLTAEHKARLKAGLDAYLASVRAGEIAPPTRPKRKTTTFVLSPEHKARIKAGRDAYWAARRAAKALETK
jgi:hypothetical protein